MMKKRLFACICLLLFVLPLCSCKTTVIPNSAEAIEKLKGLGYQVDSFVEYGEQVAIQNITQVTVVKAYKGDEYITVFFFANEEDTKTFFESRSSVPSNETEIVKKNKYSVYRGSPQAVEDFLS